MTAAVTNLRPRPDSQNGYVQLRWTNPAGTTQTLVEAFDTEQNAWVSEYLGTALTQRNIYPPWDFPWDYRVSANDGSGWSTPALLPGVILPPHAGVGRVSLNSVDVPSLWTPLWGYDQDDNAINWQTQRDIALFTPAGSRDADMLLGSHVSKLADQMDWIIPPYTDDQGMRQAVWAMARRIETMADQGHLVQYRDSTPRIQYSRVMVVRVRNFASVMTRVSLSLQSAKPPPYPLTS